MLVLLQSSDPSELSARREARFARRLMKPALPGELRATLLRGTDEALLGGPEQPDTAPLPIAPLSVLMVEDHPINTHFVTVMLERQGHRVVHAKNGQEGVDASALGRFDLILMDVQMPVMDGLEATRSIRTREATTSAARVPIVALTANAMKGDAEACLEAGMDRFTSKPIHVDALHRVIAELSDAPPAVAPEVTAAPPSLRPTSMRPVRLRPRSVAYDRAALLALACGDQGFVTEILTVFVQSQDKMMSAPRQSVRACDALQVRLDAHRLKGALELICAYSAGELASALEVAGRDQRVSELAPLLSRLEHEVQRLYEAASLDAIHRRASLAPTPRPDGVRP